MSSEKFLASLKNTLIKFDESYLQNNHFDFSGKTLAEWKRNALGAIDLLEKFDVNYILLKTNDIPFALMADVDIMIEKEDQLKKLYRELLKSGYILRHIAFNDKLKLTATNPNSNFEFDFYPDSTWSELRYAKKGMITKNCRAGTRKGINSCFPKPEHEIYITSSHAYNHGRIHLLEVANTARIILDTDPSIEEIINLSEKFHFQNGTYVLLSAVNWLLNKFNYEGINEKDLNYLKSISHPCFQRIVSKGFRFDSFPMFYSVFTLFLTSASKITAHNLDKSVPRFDELSNFIKHNRVSHFIFQKFFLSSKNYHLPLD